MADGGAGKAGLCGEWMRATAALGTADQGQGGRERAGSSPRDAEQRAGGRERNCGALGSAARQ